MTDRIPINHFTRTYGTTHSRGQRYSINLSKVIIILVYHCTSVYKTQRIICYRINSNMNMKFAKIVKITYIAQIICTKTSPGASRTQPVTVGHPCFQLAGFTRFHVSLLQTIFTQTWPIESITYAGLGTFKSHVPTKRIVPHFQNMGPTALRHNKLVYILAQNLCTVIKQIIFHNKTSTTRIS